MERGGCVYMMSNKNNSTLYIGVTSNLIARVQQHKNNENPYSFTARYKLHKLVYYEAFGSIEEAIAQEKYLKGKRCSYKDELIDILNLERKDLWEEVKTGSFY